MRPGWLRLAAGGLIVSGGAVIGMSLSAYGTSTFAPHVMVIMMENKNFSGVIGQSDQPYTNSLATNGGLATASYPMVTGSLPNYLALVSGSTQNDTDNVTPSQKHFPSTQTLADQLASAGYSAKAYAENLPADPTNSSGQYEVIHFPWLYFPNTHITVADSSSLLSDLNSSSAPDFVWYTPNLIDSADTGTVQEGDAFLSTLIPQVQATSWYKTGGKVIIEWDESQSDTTGINGGSGGHIPTIVVSAALAANPQQDATPVDTVGILHSIENLYGLPYLSGASNVANGNIDALLTAGSVAPTTTNTVAPSTNTVAPTTTTTVAPSTNTVAPTTTTTVAPTTTNTVAPTTTTTVAPTTTNTVAPTTTNTVAPTTRPGVGANSGGGSGGSSDPSVVSASSSSLAFTGSGPGVGALGVIGAGLVLLGVAILALVGVPRRFVREPALVNPSGRRGKRGEGDLAAAEPWRSDLWLVRPS